MSYGISYTLNGGIQGSNAASSYTVETATFNLPTPTRTGYTFNGLFTNAQFTGSAVTSIAKGSTENKEFYAKWTANTYTLTYNTNGGSTLNPISKTVTYGAAVGALPNAARAGYNNSTTWNTSANGSGTAYTSSTTYTVAGNTTIYAQWGTSITYTVSYVLNGGTNPSNPSTNYNVTLSVTLPSPTRTDYAFYGWYADSNFTGSKVTTISEGSTGDKTFYAKWTRTSNTVYINNGGSIHAVEDKGHNHTEFQYSGLSVSELIALGYTKITISGTFDVKARYTTTLNKQRVWLDINGANSWSNDSLSVPKDWTEKSISVTIDLTNLPDNFSIRFGFESKGYIPIHNDDWYFGTAILTLTAS
jgi:uncharacterized repeat protein (TIGR02543 family)